ncbi:ycf49-like protein [Quercus suber]|uniref:Ycf49-like protein n=1 Tax=Quercus suber TaxID=58331 RepID=A0AAW0J609_QUESU
MAITTLFYPPKLSFPHRPTRQVSSSTPHSKTQTQIQTRTRNSINHGTIQNPKTTMAAALLGAGLTLTLVGPTSAAELPSLLLLGSTSMQLSEPTNALSLPTWAIHVSSVVEWITAMALVWQYGEQSGYESWKGLSWGMVPLLGGAFCACTWHFFYNSESLEDVLHVCQETGHKMPEASTFMMRSD